jgi:hypothetical protein
LTSLVELGGAAVVPEHVEQPADGGGSVLGSDHGSSLAYCCRFVY